MYKLFTQVNYNNRLLLILDYNKGKQDNNEVNLDTTNFEKISSSKCNSRVKRKLTYDLSSSSDEGYFSLIGFYISLFLF